MNQIFPTAFLLLLPICAAAGSLTPPGAPAPTMKTLDEVEARIPIHKEDLPLTISHPGSYFLAENIHFVGNSLGIHITTSSVSIDLNGFTLKGSGAPTGQIRYTAIESDTDTTGIVIRNGSIVDWTNNGITLHSAASTIENVYVARCHSGVVTNDCRLINCTIEYHRVTGYRQFTTGLQPSTASIISGCIVSNNGHDGIVINRTGLVTNNTCSNNGRSGISVHVAECRVEGNQLVRNNGTGLYMFRSVAIKNTATGNGQDYDFFPGSTHGPIVTGGSAIASDNPWANISY